MTWPECLDLILTILAQIPYDWVMVGIVIGMILSAVIFMAVIVEVLNEDAGRRDVYYEDHIANHEGEK